MRKNTSDSQENLTNKWGEGSLCLGWTAFPTSLMFLQARLGMTSTDLNVLLNLMIHWWGEKDPIHPSQDAIAYRMGVSKRTVQRTLSRLEEIGIIQIKETKRNSKFKGRNIYILTPLVRELDTLSPMVKENIYSSKAKNKINEQ